MTVLCDNCEETGAIGSMGGTLQEVATSNGVAHPGFLTVVSDMVNVGSYAVRMAADGSSAQAHRHVLYWASCPDIDVHMRFWHRFDAYGGTTQLFGAIIAGLIDSAYIFPTTGPRLPRTDHPYYDIGTVGNFGDVASVAVGGVEVAPDTWYLHEFHVIRSPRSVDHYIGGVLNAQYTGALSSSSDDDRPWIGSWAGDYAAGAWSTPAHWFDAIQVYADQPLPSASGVAFRLVVS